MTAQEFLAAIRQIVAEAPTYRIRGTGEDGTCDCVGLIMGAINRVEKTGYKLHSSNYFARWQTDELEPVEAAELLPGMLVYKARSDTTDLHGRYLPGGDFDNGDYNDYYHVGVVVATSPVEIVHCTSGKGVDGIAHDYSVKGWTHAGKAAQVEYIAAQDARTAAVHTDDGNPLKLRPTPSTEMDYIAKIPHGDAVQVYADAEGWAKVAWRGKTGYCMSKYLRYAGATAPTEDVPQWGMQIIRLLEEIISLLKGGDHK